MAIVTGASDGLGKEFAHGLAEAGATVVVAARRADLLERFAADLHDEHGTPALAVATDVTSEAEVVALVEQTVAAFGTVDVLVNNAGMTRMQPFLEHGVEEWREVIEVNLTGSFLMAREVAKVMTARTSGSIINVSSVFALGATRQFPVISYYAAKGGVEGLTKGLAVELGSSNVGSTRSPRASSRRRCPRACSARTSPARPFAATCSSRVRHYRHCRRARTCAGPCATSRATSRLSSPASCWSSTAAGVPSRTVMLFLTSNLQESA